MKTPTAASPAQISTYKMHERLENSRGTVIYLSGKTSGLATSRGIDKFAIELK